MRRYLWYQIEFREKLAQKFCKLRAWDPKEKVMRYDVKICNNKVYYEGGNKSLSEVILMQSVPGVSRFQKLYYEGDIVEFPYINVRSIIEVDPITLDWKPVIGNQSSWEVIGNIYEHKELIRGHRSL